MSIFKGKFTITSPRGFRTHPITGEKNSYHKGVDIVGIDSNIILCGASGIVEATPYEHNGFGYYVRIRTIDNKRLYYAHMKKDSFMVKTGDKVNIGTPLGIMGSTGSSTGLHVHVELRDSGTGKNDLDVNSYLGIPNIKGTYVGENEEFYNAIKQVQRKAKLENKTMSYLEAYEWGRDLIMKLHYAMR